MTDAPTPARRYPDISPAEWARVESQVFLLVAKRSQGALDDPKAIAAEAIRRAQDPEYKEWDRAKTTLVRYVGSIANSLVANAFRKLGFKTTAAVDPTTLEAVQDSGTRPDEAYTREEARAIAEARLTKVGESVADDPCCVLLLDAVRRGEERPREIAEAAGFSYDDVRAARRKIERAALKVVAEEARVAKTKGYIR